jgi:precorrin-4/cobalt-precorrin-4 C11-methyltransferase
MKKALMVLLATVVMGITNYSHAQMERARIERGKIYFVGVGPGGPHLCTVQAMRVIRNADVVYTTFGLDKIFAAHLQGRDVRDAKVDEIYKIDGKWYLEFSWEEHKQLGEREKEWGRRMAQELKAEANKGKAVAFLENGDACIYGMFGIIQPYLDKNDYIVIPGLSSFNVGNARLGRDVAKTPSNNTSPVILCTNLGKEPHEIERLARLQATMVFYMSIGKLENLVKILRKHYHRSTPIAICRYLGLPKEEIIIGTLEDIVSKYKVEDVKMTLIYVGDFLR